MESELWDASEANNPERVREILSQHPKVDVNWRKQSYLGGIFHLACKAGRLEVAQLLLAHPGLDINGLNQADQTALELACEYGRVSIVRMLVADSRVKVNYGGKKFPLYFACQEGRTEVVRLLLAHHDIDVNRRYSAGYSPFLIACWSGRADVVWELLKDGRADVNSQDDCSRSPLWLAATGRHLDVIRCMVASGRPLDLRPRAKVFGKSTLTLDAAEAAELEGHAEVTRFLQRYRQHAAMVTYEVRLDLNLVELLAADLFALVVLVSDKFFVLPGTTSSFGQAQAKSQSQSQSQTPGYSQSDEQQARRSRRFLTLISRLPVELQMIISFRAFASSRDIIPKKAIEKAIVFAFQTL